MTIKQSERPLCAVGDMVHFKYNHRVLTGRLHCLGAIVPVIGRMPRLPVTIMMRRRHKETNEVIEVGVVVGVKDILGKVKKKEGDNNAHGNEH